MQRVTHTARPGGTTWLARLALLLLALLGTLALYVLRSSSSGSVRAQERREAAHVQPPKRQLGMSARLGAKWAYSQDLNDTSEEPVRLYLRTQHELDVRVLNDKGEPQAGVPVALRLRQGSEQRVTYQALTQAQDG